MASSEINVLAELEREKIEYEYASETEVKTLCPFHTSKGKNKNCFVNIEKRSFYCHSAGCNKDGGIVRYLAAARNMTRAEVLQDLGKRYDLSEDKTIDPQTVERFW